MKINSLLVREILWQWYKLTFFARECKGMSIMLLPWFQWTKSANVLYPMLFKSLGVKILGVLYLHYNVAFKFK